MFVLGQVLAISINQDAFALTIDLPKLAIFENPGTIYNHVENAY
jgi:hypothetical protein